MSNLISLWWKGLRGNRGMSKRTGGNDPKGDDSEVLGVLMEIHTQQRSCRSVSFHTLLPSYPPAAGIQQYGFDVAALCVDVCATVCEFAEEK